MGHRGKQNLEKLFLSILKTRLMIAYVIRSEREAIEIAQELASEFAQEASEDS